MKGARVLAAEFVISIGISSWAAMKQGFWPWPPVVIKTGIAFALLAMLAIASEELAALLGAGFIIANLVRLPADAQGHFKFTGGIDKQHPYAGLFLQLGGDAAANKPASGGVSPSGLTTGGSGGAPSSGGGTVQA